MIQFKNVTKKYHVKNGTLTAVNHVNLSIKAGEIYGIIGYSGAGKSTLVKMINGLEVPTSGEVDINGQDVTSLSTRESRQQRQQIGTIFQHFDLLWSRTILGNVTLPLEIAGIPKTERDHRALKLLSLVGLKDRAHDYPSELSGGQKQRVGIARALVNSPKILISDEATSALDPQTTDEILNLLLKINQKMGLTIVLITHEMHAIRKVANKVAVMDNGSVVEKGSLLDIFNHPKQAITRRFVSEDSSSDHQDTHMTLHEMVKSYPEGSIVRLRFDGHQSQQPIVSKVIHRTDNLELSIIAGNIKPVKGYLMGSLMVQLIGSDQSKAIQDFQKLNVKTEVLHRG